MDNSFLLVPTLIQNKQALEEIIKCNETTTDYGLTLTGAQAQELVQTRSKALSSNGRIEFGGGIIDKLIIEFCDSPFLTQYNYTETLNELIETFYYIKGESLEEISDDKLISLMKKCFDGICKGSVDLLQNRELETLAHNIRFGIKDYANICEYEKVEYFDEENDCE